MRGDTPRERVGGWTGLAAALLLASSTGSVGCVHHHHHGEVAPPEHAGSHGPPPHAPAHGHRRKHQRDKVEMVFDAEVGVWVVVGHRHHYHDGQHYFRWTDGEWMVSLQLDHGWVVIANRDVPPRLVAKHAGKQHKGKKKGHHRHPAKHDDWDDWDD
jgi:hypothetical protein